MRSSIVILTGFCVVLGFQGGQTLAQAKNPKQDVNSIYNVNAVYTQAVLNISRRYNLNKEQHEQTQKMMEDGVNRFLREHADEIYPLIRDLTAAGMNVHDLTPEQRRRIGKAAQPLIADAEETIKEYNAQWRNILSDDQKQLHDWDLQEMEGQFDAIENNFRRMSKGLAVDDNPIFPKVEPRTQAPPLPKKPTAGIPKPPPPVKDRGEEGVFDRYVKKFIQDYQLDAGQIDAANSILREFKARADVYRNTKKHAYDDARTKAEKGRKEGNLDAVKEAEAQIEVLNARI
ncbi:MAG: hypothetical protein ACE5GE_14790, partial [Phycisphaerae bacterium]